MAEDIPVEMHHAALPSRLSRRCSAALSIRPRQASEMISCTPVRPRSTRCQRNADQPDLSSLAPSQNAEDRAKSFRVDRAGHQERDIANLAGPAALQRLADVTHA